MDFYLHINMDNAAFDENRVGELQRILLNVAGRLEGGYPGTVRDINGNTVGQFDIKED